MRREGAPRPYGRGAAILAGLLLAACQPQGDAKQTGQVQLVEPGYLTVGTSLSAPPMGFVKDGQPVGFDPELITAIANEMGLKVRIVNVPFQGLFPGLIAGKFDVLASQIGITDARKEAFDFVPVFIGGLRLVAKAGSGLKFQTESDVCGHSASIVAGSTPMAALERVKAECPPGKPMTLKVFTNQSEAVNEVGKGAVEVAYIDWPVAASLVRQKPDEFAEASPILSGRGPNTGRNRNGIVFRKNDLATRDAVAAALKSVVAKGSYDEILKRWNLADGNVAKAN